MWTVRPLALLALAALLLIPSAAPAEAPAAAGVQALKLSAELARAGRARHDPWLLATAARLRREIPVQAVDRPPEGGAAEAYDPAASWLAEAEEMGSDDPRLAGFITEVRSFAFRGRSGGPKVSTARLLAGGVHRYGAVFGADQPAVVYVEGDGDSNLALTVRDASGAATCTDGGPGDVKICTWTPRATAAFRIEIANRGAVDDRYAFATN